MNDLLNQVNVDVLEALDSIKRLERAFVSFVAVTTGQVRIDAGVEGESVVREQMMSDLDDIKADVIISLGG